MADVKWIKLAVDMFDNRKIRQIETLPDGDGIIVIWVKLLCLAGITNDGGLVYFTRDIPYTEQMLANYFQRPIALVQMALRVFQQFGMIDLVDDIIMVSGWEKYQSLDRLERIQAQNRERQRRFKEQKRKDALPVTLPVTEDNASDKEEDIDRDIEYIAQAPTPTEPKPPKSSKHKYGEYGWVQLSDEQYGSLLRDLGQVELDRCISYIDESAQSSGNKNRWKDWNLVIRRCHREGWGLRRQSYGQAQAPKQQAGGNPFADMLRQMHQEDQPDVIGIYDYGEESGK